jgi:predicted secreted protein
VVIALFALLAAGLRKSDAEDAVAAGMVADPA